LDSLGPSLVVMNTALPRGVYTFYFGLDNPKGSAADPWQGFDSVRVSVPDPFRMQNE